MGYLLKAPKQVQCWSPIQRIRFCVLHIRRGLYSRGVLEIYLGLDDDFFAVDGAGLARPAGILLFVWIFLYNRPHLEYIF